MTLNSKGDDAERQRQRREATEEKRQMQKGKDATPVAGAMPADVADEMNDDEGDDDAEKDE